jgi:N-acetylmuramoyl-L-alanine amidase
MLAMLGSVFGQGNNFNIVFSNLGDINKLKMFNDSVYVFGTITPKDANLTINDKKIKVHKDGGFLAYIKLDILKEQNAEKYNKGIIKSTIEYKGKAETFENIVWVKPPLKTIPFKDVPIIDNTSIMPNVDYNVKEGTLIEVSFLGTPGCTALFEVEGINKIFPMTETVFVNSYFWGDAAFGKGFSSIGDTIKGFYKGFFKVTGNLKNSRIKVYLKYKKDKNSFVEVKDFAESKISTFKDEDLFVVSTKKDNNMTIGRSKPQAGYVVFLQDNIKLLVTGIIGNWYEVKLAENKHIYVNKNNVETLPAGTPPVMNNIQAIRTESKNGFTEIQFGFLERVPVEIRQHNPNKFELFFYNTSIEIDWIRFDPKDSLVKEIKHYQDNDGVMKVEIVLNQKAHWGYYSEYEGNNYILKIKQPLKQQQNVLENRTIVIDPGHNPESGASGPYGTIEKNINYTLSVLLKEKLEEKGAKVFLTRPFIDSPLPLYERRGKITSFNPDFVISMHNNAVPQNMDPTIYNGYSSYYYNPQAQKLAELINNNFRKI